MLGDRRWGGLYGIDADFVAEENSKAVLVLASDFQVPAAQGVSKIAFRSRPALDPQSLDSLSIIASGSTLHQNHPLRRGNIYIRPPFENRRAESALAYRRQRIRLHAPIRCIAGCLSTDSWGACQRSESPERPECDPSHPSDASL